MTDDRRKPAAFRLDPEPKSKAQKPKTKRKPRAMPAPEIHIEPETNDAPLVPASQPEAAVARTIRWASLLFTSLTALFTLWAGVAITGFIEDLFKRSELLGWIGSGLLAAAGLALLAMIVREATGLLRLRKLETVQEAAARAVTMDDKQAANTVLSALKNIYAGRADTAWGMDRLKDSLNDIIDPADRIRLIERDLMTGLDEQAGRIIARSARRVALVTAVTPVAALDILLVAMQNLKMLRAIATTYGGRPGTFGTFKLARMVIGHLAVAGGLALSDNLIQHIIGKGLIGRLSSRFGEGAVNGILTARIGLAALDLTRPIPFMTGTKPALADFLREIVSFGGGEKKND